MYGEPGGRSWLDRQGSFFVLVWCFRTDYHDIVSRGEEMR
jgi:hypothetical protein